MSDLASDSPEYLEDKLPGEIKKENIILTEGIDGRYVFAKLTRYIGVQDHYHVFPVGSKDNFRAYLEEIVKYPNFPSVRGLILVRDADDNPKGAVKSLQDCIQYINKQSKNRVDFPVPNDSYKIERNNSFASSLITLPTKDEEGELEDLCLKSVGEEPAMDCVNNYMDCLVDTTERVESPSSKQRAYAYIASHSDPDIRVGLAAQKEIWDFDHECFDEIKRILKNL